MAKDPAFLFYPGDWMGGTMGMSLEEKGAYLELLLFQFNKGKFPENKAINIVRSIELWKSVKDKFVEENGLFFNRRLEIEQSKRKNYTESRRQARSKGDEDNVRIYIVRDNVRLTYKVGSSVNPIRRYNELTNQISPAIMQTENAKDRNLTLLWYSNPVLRTVEKQVHAQFSEKKISGEWFALTQEDIDIITLTYEGTYVNRTSKRTEDENENINTIVTNYNNKVTTPENSFLWTDQLKAFNNDFRWKEKFCRDKTIKMPVLENLMARYISDIELKEDFKETKELKNHFTNWYNKNSKNGFTNSGNEQKLGTSEARTEALRNWGA